MTIFLITFFLTFTLICAKNIRCGIYAVIFSMPLYLIRFSIFGIPTTVLEIMIYILFLTWVLSKIEKVLSYDKFYSVLIPSTRDFNGFSRFRKNNFILSIGIILLFLGLVLSTLHSSDLKTSLGICKGWFFDPFLFFIVFISVIKEKKHIMSSFVSWGFSGLAVSLASILYLLNSELTFDGRLKAFYISPNYLAMYLAPVFLVVLFFILSNRKLNIGKISNIKYQVSSVILIIIFLPLFFTYSYGAFLGIFAGAVWLFYKTINSHSNKIKRISKNPFFKIIILTVFISFLFVTAVKLNQIINSENRSSFHSRLMIWNVSVEIIKDNPVFGIGPGTFQEIYLSYSKKFDEPYLEWAVTQPHNTFLAFYLQTGLLGFIGFILILVWFLKSSLKHNNIQHPTSNILIALVIYILVHSLVDTMYWKNDLSLMFWLVAGLLLTSSKICDTMQS